MNNVRLEVGINFVDYLIFSGLMSLVLGIVVYASYKEGPEKARKNAQAYRMWIHDHIAPEVLHYFSLTMTTLMLALILYLFFRELVIKLG